MKSSLTKALIATVFASVSTGVMANEQKVSVNGAIVNKAIGPGAVSEQNLPGRSSTVINGTVTTVNGKTTVTQGPSGPVRADAEDFINAKLQGVNFAKKNFKGKDFTNADLRNANLSHANLEDAILINANFAGADLSGANLKGADITNANFEGAKTDGTIW
ncbi:MAG: pentapeptide repeat-containing protein [Aggregatibacter aphrophilus]|jgi:pentapeptide repeat protein|uniref:pentapeptide repeat-containing protein n=1 Tax=Aggregatibacter aphrophilus TaxID=732 RepID=UPI0029116E62|nr:pentapeptide repeat-containing protein [Aggregatibacter aphrophilus]MDU7786315.1 pentapeptide repeat-containing protein [Aggregatibacter aphrophilus]